VKAEHREQQPEQALDFDPQRVQPALLGAAGAVGSVSVVTGSLFKTVMPFVNRERFDDHKGLRPGVIIGQRQMNVRLIAIWHHRVEPCLCTAGQRQALERPMAR
jgi:hypothetical protein